MSDTVWVCLITGVCSVVSAWCGAWISRAGAERVARIEDKKNRRELALKIALIKHEERSRLAQQIADQTGRDIRTPPLNAFILESMKFMESVGEAKLSATNLAQAISEHQDFTEQIGAAIKQQQKKKEGELHRAPPPVPE